MSLFVFSLGVTVGLFASVSHCSSLLPKSSLCRILAEEGHICRGGTHGVYRSSCLRGQARKALSTSLGSFVGRTGGGRGARGQGPKPPGWVVYGVWR